MKVCIFQLDNFAQSPFSRHVFNLAPELQNLGCEVTLITSDLLGMDALPNNVSGATFGNWIPRYLRLPRHYLAIPQMAHYMYRNRPDAIIARGVPFAISALAARFLSRQKTIVIATLHSSLTGDIATRVLRSWPVMKSLARIVVKNADHTVAVSQAVADDYVRLTEVQRDQIKVIYNPIVTPSLVQLAAEEIDEDWLKPDREHFTLVHVGRFAPEKDHKTLLLSLDELRKQHSVKLLLVGDGPCRAEIVNIIQDLGLDPNVKLLGRKSNPFSYMSRADALVLSSTYEGLPGVLVQAMALGCPVVSTDCYPGGAREILGDSVYGPLSPIGAPKELSQGILSVLKSPLPSSVLIERSNSFTSKLSAVEFVALFKRNN